MLANSTPIHGNYHGYYTKRPAVKDPRLSLLPPELFRGASVLDVGCNEGWVTCEIAQSWGARRVHGVDIDDTLTRLAWKRRRTVWSTQEPVVSIDEKSVAPLPKPGYFPASLEHTFGPLPIPSAQPADKHLFPYNVSFRTADWTNNTIPQDAMGYDVVLAFSLTKWIHLNGGDDALLRFFRRVHDVLTPGGSLVLEPQAWETYAKAKRMDNRLRENAKSLKLRPSDFESLLQEIGFGPAQHLGTTGEGGFSRPVDIYKKPA
ncbi:hypothetical protein PTI98_013521 [Pleurotus ostreatus]|nr:hypothetical protein PTI98_013521 [Pleurotus ostreatus]